MALKSLRAFSRGLDTLRSLNSSSRDPVLQCLAPRLTRSMATEASLPSGLSPVHGIQKASPDYTPNSEVLATIYKFPTMEPLRFESYNSKHLYLPLRRDILHRAVVYEGDFTRQGTANTKTRHEVHGSHRKIRPQKGTGRARLGTRQSPMLRGGGKTFGPHPRDFATQLPRKVYDLAWRTALSYRYRKGELIICDNELSMDPPRAEWLKQIMKYNHWGKEDGRTLFVAEQQRSNLWDAFQRAGDYGRALTVEEVDVKDLLELGRIVIEKSALDMILEEHQSDLVLKAKGGR